MQNFSNKLEYIVNNIKTLPYGEIIEFAKTAKQNLIIEQNKLEMQIEINKTNFNKFIELIKEPNQQKTKNPINIIKLIGGVNIELPLITNILETKKYPGIPCAFAEISEWSFIYFPQLNQILPVHNIIQILTPFSKNTCTKLHYGLFKDIAIEHLNDSFAIIPFTQQTWAKFTKIPLNNWENYLNQLNIGPLNLKNTYSQKIPIYTTTGLVDIAKTLKPEDMAVQWSLFVQLYMLLYLFKHASSKEHFTCF